jgi:uncharacterized protein
MLWLEALDTYLSSDAAPDDCLMLSDLDGFLHGVACAPVPIPSEEWLPVAFGACPERMPRDVLHTILALHNEICAGLLEDPPDVEPMFWETKDGQVIAMDWCEGFMQAVSMRPKEWLRLTESGSHGELMTPILCHLIDGDGNSLGARHTAGPAYRDAGRGG